MAEKGAGRGRERELVGEIAVFAAVVVMDDEYGERALERIGDERGGGKAFAAGA